MSSACGEIKDIKRDFDCEYLNLTSSDFVNKKYTEFYNKHGYIPKMFNPYNCAEIIDVAPTMTTYCGNKTSSVTVMIFEEIKND